MSDFMKWLYTHYILPQLKEADPQGYEMDISLMDTNLCSWQKHHYARVIEFVAIHTFLLGLRTGVGLRGELPTTAK